MKNPNANSDQIARKDMDSPVGLDGGHAIKTESPAFDTIQGYPMKLPTLDEMKEYIQATKLPFF